MSATIVIHTFSSGGDDMEDGGTFARVSGIHESVQDESWDGGRPFFQMKCYRAGKISKELANEIKSHLVKFFTDNPKEITCPIEYQVEKRIAKKQEVTVITGFRPLPLNSTGKAA